MQDWSLITIGMIDTRSFSNLWYWVVLAVVWAGCSHWVLGVPYDMVVRAKRQGGEAEADLCDVVRVNVNRILDVFEAAGVWPAAIGGCVFSMLAVLGFGYGLELAQAVFLLLFPPGIVAGMSVRAARKMRDADGEGLYETMGRLRTLTQLVGFLSIFVTALWGMWQNMTTGIL